MNRPESDRRLWTPLRLFLAAIATVVAVGAGLSLSSLVMEVRQQIERLAVASPHTSNWSLVQADVELLALMVEVQAALDAPDHPLDALRQRFDVYYGRSLTIAGTMRPVTARELADFEHGETRITAFLQRFTPILDSGDAALRQALPDMLAQAQELRSAQRQLTMASQRASVVALDAQRSEAAATLQRIGVLTLALFGALVVMIALLARLVRKAARNARLQALAQGQLAAIIKASADAIMVIRRDGTISDCNEAAERIFGYDAAEIRGRHISSFIAEDTPDPAEGEGEEGIFTPRARFRRVVGIRRHGKRFPAEYTFTTATTEAGSVNVCFLHDISYRYAAERALIDARDRALAGEKAKADMLAVMSHEMRTPLNGILGTLQLIDLKPLSPDLQNHLNIIRSSGEQLLGHVNDVLDISRLDAGKISLNLVNFDLPDLLHAVVANQLGAAALRGNRLTIAPIAADLNIVRGDAQKLRQVLLNLIGNAIKFTRKGEVILSARRLDARDVELQIRDSGMGISAEDLGRVFDEFVTLDASYGRSSAGTGLGLPISRRLTQAMQGQLRASSELGQGSTFQIILPLPIAHVVTKPRVPAQGAMPAPATAVAPLNILVVEDNSINRFVVTSMLERDGHHVSEAQNGEIGVQTAARSRFDLILMDIAMPVLDGVAATVAIRSGEGPNRDTPIVALTAHALPADLLRFEEAGIHQTLNKPLSAEALRETLGTLGTAARKAPKGPTAAATQGHPPLLDLSKVTALSEALGTASYADLKRQFLHETEQEIRAMHALLSAPEIACIAHRIAGSAATFGTSALAKLLVSIETAARAEDHDGLKLLLAKIDQLWDNSRAALIALDPEDEG